MPRTQVNDSQIAYMAYQNAQAGKRHHTHDEDMRQYHLMAAGDPKAVEEADRIIRSGLPGHVSDDPVRNAKYLFVCTVTLATRFAIEAGMDSETAYNASDLYILRMDRLQTVDEVLALRHDLFVFFTARCGALKKEKVYSLPVVRAMDYIRYHLADHIRLADIADYVELNPSYLSALFKRECGISVTDYIAEERVETAKNMLRYSRLSMTQIAQALGFATPSYFTKVFRERTGFAPTEFRERFFRKSGFSDDE